MRSFRRLELGPWTLVVARSYEEPLLALDLAQRPNLEALSDLAQSRAMGRGTNAILALPGRRERMHLRPIRHGGLLAEITGSRLVGLRRPLAELHATHVLRSQGAPVPEPILVIGRRVGLFWETAFGSVHEEDCLDGSSFLGSSPSPKRVLRAAGAAGRAIRMLHDLGGHHTDLHIKNLLIREGSGRCEVVVVDLDRARVGSPPSPQQRMQALARLARSLIKRGLTSAAGPHVSAAFLSAYLQGDRDLWRSMRTYESRERLRIRAHALLYRERA